MEKGQQRASAYESGSSGGEGTKRLPRKRGQEILPWGSICPLLSPKNEPAKCLALRVMRVSTQGRSPAWGAGAHTI